MAVKRDDASVRGFLRSLEQRHKGTESDKAALGAIANGFAAAKRDRFTDDWVPGQIHPASLHRSDAKVMRDRARDLILNNPLAKAGVDAYLSNVLETGIGPKPKFHDPETRGAWLSAWDRWAGEFDNEADSTGVSHLNELQALWLEEVIVGGGCLLHFVEYPRGRRSLPLAIELIPEERFADESDSFLAWQTSKKSANPIVRGIELDSSSGRVVNYWLKPIDLTGLNPQYEPIALPAADCRYAYIRKRIGQYRGYTMLHAAIMWLWKLGYYTDNELMASAVKSCFAAVITTNEDAFATLSDGEQEAADEFCNGLEKLQPAMVARVRPGESVTGVGPNLPGSDGSSWIEFIERSIAVSLGLSYEELCRDYSKGSFSSVRASANADRKRFRTMQRFVVNHFCSPIYRRFAESAVRVGLQGFPRPSQYVSAPEDYLAVGWRTPGWETVNPLDDARADDIKLRNGSRTLEQIASREGGSDWEENLEQRDREQRKADELQLRITGSDYDPEVMSIQTANDTQGAGSGK